MRDIAPPPPCLPNVADDLAAHVEAAGLAAAHDALGRRNHRDPEAAVDPRDVGGLRVDPQARLADAADAGQDRDVLAGVLEVDPQLLEWLVLDDLIAIDEALVAQ